MVLLIDTSMMKYHLELSILLQKRANQLCLFYRIFASGQELIIKRIVKTHYFNVKSVTINRRKI
jgi:hypothetical protein